MSARAQDGASVAMGAGTTFERAFVRASLCGLIALPFALDTPWTALAWNLPLALLGADFLDHHAHPRRTLEVGFYKSAFRSCAWVALPLSLAALSITGHPALVAFLYSLALLSLFAPQLHKLAHDKRCAPWIQILQRARIILSPRAHALHHARPQNRAYCIVTGWCNPPLDALGFWTTLDRWLTRRDRRNARSEAQDVRST